MSSDSQLQQQHKNDQSTQQKPLDENSIIARYRALSTECTNLTQKIAELDQDRNEHSLVAETLKPLDSSRRAFRLIGGVLVERTVGEVLPSVVNNKENVSFSINFFLVVYLLETFFGKLILVTTIQ